MKTALKIPTLRLATLAGVLNPKKKMASCIE